MKRRLHICIAVLAACANEPTQTVTKSGIVAELCAGRRAAVPTTESCSKVPFDVAMQHPRDVRQPIHVFQEAFWLRAIDCFQHGMAPGWVLPVMQRHAEENVSAAIAVGNFHLHNGNQFEAIDAYNDAIAIDPDVPHAYYDRAIVHIQLGQMEKALADVFVAVRLSDLSCADIESDPDFAPILLEPSWPSSCVDAARR